MAAFSSVLILFSLESLETSAKTVMAARERRKPIRIWCSASASPVHPWLIGDDLTETIMHDGTKASPLAMPGLS